MSKIELPYFGYIDPFDLQPDYMRNMYHRGIKVGLDLNFENEWITPDKLFAVKKMLGSLVSLDLRNRQYLEADFRDEEGTVRYYLEFFLKNTWKGSLVKLINYENKEIAPIDQLLKKIHLIRVGFYPENEDVYAVFDYSVGLKYTEYVLAVNLNELGKVEVLTMEL